MKPYTRNYDRESGRLDTFIVVILCVAVAMILFSAVWDQVTHPHSVAAPACEMRNGLWTKTGNECEDASEPATCHDVYECRYRVTSRIGEMP